jgi:parvulin-like peptidyl-prolyl isomerase
MSQEPGKKPVVHKKHVARLQREQQQSRLILYTFFGILGAVVLLLLYGWLDAQYFQLQRPIAKVGDVKILVKDFEPRVRLQRQQLLNDYTQYAQYAQVFGIDVETQLQQIAGSLNSPEIVGEQVVEQMIREELVRQEAAKRGITVSEEELNKAIEEAFGYFPNGTPTAAPTATSFVTPEIPAEAFAIVSVTPPPSATPQATAGAESTEEAETATATPAPTNTAVPTAGPTSTPQPTSTPYTADAFQETLSETDEGLLKFGFDKEFYRSFFKAQLLEQKLKDEITKEVKSTETQVWARHILVADAATAEDVLNRLADGGDFGELAKEFSSDTGSAVNGGDLGWFGPNMMVPEFEAAAFALEKPGDYTLEPVESQFGFHIIQLIAKQERPLSESQLSLAINVEFQKWINEAREEYGVEVFDIWRQRVPNTPNFVTAATESAELQLTAQAEALEQFISTETPQP